MASWTMGHPAPMRTITCSASGSPSYSKSLEDRENQGPFRAVYLLSTAKASDGRKQIEWRRRYRGRRR